MSKVWQQSGEVFFLEDSSTQIDFLPQGIYRLSFNEAIGRHVLVYMSEEFNFNYKIYGKDQPFIDRVIKSFKHTTQNMGVMLNGVKGSGKTVTASCIANASQLPVIIVSSQVPGLPQWINSVPQDVVIYIDEYDKIYKDSDSLLSILDGVFNSDFKRLFLLTTNTKFVSPYLINRPGRIKYYKTYESISNEVVQEIIDDILINKEHTEDLIGLANNVEDFTIDLLKSIIEEMNFHNYSVKEATADFNVEVEVPSYNVYKLDNEKHNVERLVYSKVTFRNSHNFVKDPESFLEKDLEFYTKDSYVGEIEKIINIEDDIVTSEIEVYNKETEEYDKKEVRYRISRAFSTKYGYSMAF